MIHERQSMTDKQRTRIYKNRWFAKFAARQHLNANQ